MDKITEAKKQVKLRNWQMMYSEYQASGQTVRKWCEDKNLSTKTFYYRLRKIREATITQEQHEIVVLNNADCGVKQSSEKSKTIRINGCGITAEHPQNISTKLLTALLKGLSSC